MQRRSFESKGWSTPTFLSTSQRARWVASLCIMQAALRHLGVVNTNERVRRYISDLQKQKQQELEHDIDCICLDCERRQGAFLHSL